MQLKPLYRRVKPYLPWLFALAGAFVIYLLVKDVGADQLLRRLKSAAPWLPVAFALELVRMAFDAWATRQAIGEEASKIPLSQLFRAQIIGTGVSGIAPMGRTAEEATKAVLLSKWVARERTAAAGVVNQAATFYSGGLVSFPCAIAAWALTKSWVLTGALVAHGFALLALGLLLCYACRSEKLMGWLGKHIHSLRDHSDEFRDIMKDQGWFPWGPIACLSGARLVQILQFGVMAYSVGVTFSVGIAFLFQGLNLLALMVGSFVPAQMGVMGAVFVYAAKRSTSFSAAQAMSVALLIHVIQALVAGLSAMIPLFWKAPTQPEVSSRRKGGSTKGGALLPS